MLDHDHRVALVDQAVQHAEQLGDVLEVQAGGRLVEDVDRPPRRAPLQLGRELHALGLAAGQRRGRLAQAHVAEPDVDQRVHVPPDRVDRLEEDRGLLDRHVEHLGDRLALVVHLERLAVVAGPVAHLAGHVDVGQEVHLDLDRAVAGAVLAAAALDVEREPARLVTAGLGLGGLGEQLADAVEHPGVGRGVGPRRPPDRALVDVDGLVDVLEPGDLAVPTGHVLGRVQVPGQRLGQDVVDQRALARPGHPGDGHHAAERELHRHVAQVVLGRALHAERLAVARAPDGGHRDAAASGQVRTGQRLLVGQQLLHRARHDDVAAVLTRAGADVDDVVGGADRVFVVLDDDQGVAQVAQPDERVDQPPVVALVQADARLVEHVQDADQARADLRGQPDALRLATGQAAGRPGQREVLEADVEQEPQPFADLLDHPLGDGGLALGEHQPAHERLGVCDRQVRDLGDVEPADRDGQRGGLEPGALARVAGALAHEAGEPVARVVALGLGEPAPHVRQRALEAGVVARAPPVAVDVGDPQRALDAVEDHVLDLGRQVLERGVDREVVHLCERAEDRLEVARDVHRVPRHHRVVGQALAAVGHDQVGVDLHARAEARARRAGTPRRVERELAGLQLLQRDVVVVRAGQLLGVPAVPLGVALGHVDELDLDDALGEVERGLDRVGQALLDGRLGRQPVDHHLDVVADLLVERGRVGELVDLTVDAHAGEALRDVGAHQLDVLALAAAHDRGEHHEPGALGQLEQPVDDLLRRLPGDGLAALGAVRVADARVQQAQVVVDLGDRAHRRARVAAGRLLVDRHGGAEALDEVDVGLVHLPQELAGVRGQRLDVAALALGEDRVERQRRLARAGQPGEDDEGIARKLEAHVPQVVLARTSDDQAFSHPHHVRRGP